MRKRRRVTTSPLSMTCRVTTLERDTIQETELTSGLYYGCVVVDLPGLVENFGGDAGLAGQVLHNLIYLIAEVSPGAKLGSTAPYGRASFMLLEAGDRQPRSLAEALPDSVRPPYRSGGLSSVVVSWFARRGLCNWREAPSNVSGECRGARGRPRIAGRSRCLGGRPSKGIAAVTRQWLILRLDAPMMSFGGVAIDPRRPGTGIPCGLDADWTHRQCTRLALVGRRYASSDPRPAGFCRTS